MSVPSFIAVPALGLAILLGSALALANSSGVTLQLRFDCMFFDGDCAAVQLIEAPTDQRDLHLTESTGSREEALRGKAIANGILEMGLGELRFVKIAYVNEGDRPIRFRALPHAVEPPALQVLTLMQCMCIGEPYTVAAGEAWYRIIRVGAAQDMPPGARMVVTHILTSVNVLPEAHWHGHEHHHDHSEHK